MKPPEVNSLPRLFIYGGDFFYSVQFIHPPVRCIKICTENCEKCENSQISHFSYVIFLYLILHFCLLFLYSIIYYVYNTERLNL